MTESIPHFMFIRTTAITSLIAIYMARGISILQGALTLLTVVQIHWVAATLGLVIQYAGEVKTFLAKLYHPY